MIMFKISLNSNSFDATNSIKVPFFRFSVTIEPGHSLHTVHYQELFEKLGGIAFEIYWIIGQFTHKNPADIKMSFQINS